MIESNRIENFGGENASVRFVETFTVKQGVECDIYRFDQDSSKDLAIITVAPGVKTPLQKVISGTSTIEGFVAGRGRLKVTSAEGAEIEFNFDDEQPSITGISVEAGDTMQWVADETEGLVFYEICEPPYEEGRFENLTE